MPPKIRRSYIGSDPYLQEQSQTLQDQFEVDQADFAAFKAGFASPFETNWQDAIDDAVNFTDDTAVIADIEISTGAVKILMQQCRDKYIEVLFFAREAFGRKGIELKAFGSGKKYESASRSQKAMRNFMDELHQAAEKHKVKLIAADYTQLKIDAIGTLRDSFTTGNSAQNQLKIDRPEISQARMDTYNTLYDDFTRKVVDAAKIVYKTNPAKLEQYIYNPPIQHRNTIVRRVTLKKGETGNFDLTNIMDTVVPPSLVELKTKDSDGVFFAADNINGLPGADPVLVVLKNKKESRTPAQLTTEIGIGDTKPFLKVKNAGKTKGTYTVTFRF